MFDSPELFHRILVRTCLSRGSSSSSSSSYIVLDTPDRHDKPELSYFRSPGPQQRLARVVASVENPAICIARRFTAGSGSATGTMSAGGGLHNTLLDADRQSRRHGNPHHQPLAAAGAAAAASSARGGGDLAYSRMEEGSYVPVVPAPQDQDMSTSGSGGDGKLFVRVYIYET